MSTKYFILTRTRDSKVDDNTRNQILYLGDRDVHILPSVNLSYYMDNGLFECQLIEWARQFVSKDALFLDIGAHSGTYAMSLADYSKEVHCFEPQRMTYYSLCGGVALSGKTNIYCHNVGLGSEEQVGKQVLKIVSNDGGGSSLHSTSGILREEEIVVDTLDKYELQNIGFIKMDVEENELYVLMGARKTLAANNYPTILFESNHDNKALFDYIQKMGPYIIIPVGGCNNMFLASKS